MNKVLLLSVLICILTVKLSAQNSISGTGPGKVSGVIVDGQTNETIPFASAILLDRKTKANVRIAQSDANGAFTITNVPLGTFTFKASYIGYQSMVRDSIAITTESNIVDFGQIKMKPSKGNTLKEVTVTGQMPTMQLGIDKKVFSVDQSLVSEGGSATDLLQNIPSVQTDLDGNVSLRGAQGVRVLIDGKPSLIAGGNVAQVLQSIPASSIETVELITNPSAKYDAEGQSGIINIVLKKNKKLGFNGSVALTAGNRDNYNANASLSFQNSKMNIYGNYGYRYGNRLGGGFNKITYKNSLATSLGFANQITNSNDIDKGHNLKAGLDYYLAKKTVLGFSAGFNSRNEDENDILDINQLYGNLNPLQTSNRINKELSNGNSYDLNLDLSQKFKNPKEELTANISFSEGSNDSYQNYDTKISLANGIAANDQQIQRTDRDNSNRNYNAQIDYTRPIGKTGKIETGYRSQIRIAESETYADELSPVNNNFTFNYALSNLFNNKDQVHAAYLNYQDQVNNFGYQLGLRGEDARLDTRMGAYDMNSNISFTPGKVAYTRLYPSVFLTQKFKGEQQLQVSYSRRVNRPRGWDTNPFVDVSDPLNHRQGNPNLLPEDVHAFELSYSKFWNKVSLVSSIYMRRTNDIIQRVMSNPDQNGVTLTIPQNLDRSINSGVELIGKFSFFKKWNFTANTNFYQRDITASPTSGLLAKKGYSFNMNMTNNIVLPYAISLQIRGDYNSREVMAQGIRKANAAMDAGAKYDFPNKKASLSLNVRDVFNSRRWLMEVDNTNTTLDFSRYRLGRQANLTFTYRFGKTDFNFKKTKKQDDQQNQGGGQEQF